MMLEIVRTHKDVITEIPLNDTSSAIAASAATKMKQAATSSTIDWSLEDTTETDFWDETSSSFDEVAPPVRATEETTMPSCSSLHHPTLTNKRDIIPEESSFHSDTKNTDSEEDDDDSSNHADTPVEDDEVSIDFGSIQYYYTTPRSTHQSLSGSESSFSFVGSAASRSRANSMDTTDSSVGWVHEEEQNLNDSIHLRLAKLQLLPENLSSQVS